MAGKYQANLLSVEPEGTRSRVVILFFNDTMKAEVTQYIEGVVADPLAKLKELGRSGAASLDSRKSFVEAIKPLEGQAIDLTPPDVVIPDPTPIQAFGKEYYLLTGLLRGVAAGVIAPDAKQLGDQLALVIGSYKPEFASVL